MLRRLGIIALLLLAPAVVRAEEVPERLLPAGTQIYLRWDGIEPHRAAYEKLTLGKMLQGVTGGFCRGPAFHTQRGAARCRPSAGKSGPRQNAAGRHGGAGLQHFAE